MKTVPENPATYRISVSGKLDERWSDWFNGMAIEHEAVPGQSPITTLTGKVVDQAALRGLLVQIWDLGLVLISVTMVTEQPHQ